MTDIWADDGAPRYELLETPQQDPSATWLDAFFDWLGANTASCAADTYGDSPDCHYIEEARQEPGGLER